MYVRPSSVSNQESPGAGLLGGLTPILVLLLPRAIQLPSALKNFVVPPPEPWTKPAFVDEKFGIATPVPVLEVIVDVLAVYPRLVAVPGGEAHVPSALK